MRIEPIVPKKALNKAFLKQKPLRSEIDLFKENLINLLTKIDEIEREENQKNHIRDFLRDTYYKDTNEINTKDTKDLVIHLEKTNKDKVGIIIEAKRPGNKNEMLSTEKPNAKALHELILYYFDERNKAENNELKYLIITNVYEWFIIDANYFDKVIYRNTKIKKLYETYINDKKDTPFFYEEVSKIIPQIDSEIPCTYFDIRNYEKVLKNENKADDKNLIALFKILSPHHLLKTPFANDSNSLNDKFYKELLHIIGLEEAKEGNKNIIRRKKENRNSGSLLENTISAIETEDPLHRIPDLSLYGDSKQDRVYNIALELCITWINRILFLKLLEGQLENYHKGDKQYRFLNVETIHDFDELFKLFHKVLAINFSERTEAIKNKYSKIPYLNSSLFEISELEDQAIKINSLDNSEPLELINNTILKDIQKKTNKLTNLDYLFKFLDAYDFASEGKTEIQEENKSIINASVLGKVFEKINGYKDGSIFTPGFITMYMCRQSVRLAVIQKFKNKYGWNVEKFEDLKNYLADRKSSKDILEFNEVINSLKMCDPAVGSGHFLVSLLNEIIAIKYELGLLADENGIRITDYEVSIENDELILTDSSDDIFEYTIHNGKPITKEVQRIQKTLFREKQTIIENCLFGVDINPNSVKICRLRLWIELLKNAYYKEDGTLSGAEKYTELETLPNIDINIKCGNSLISRYALDSDLSKALKSIKYDIKAYRGFVNDYKNEKSRDVKRGLQKIIDSIKNDFRTQISQNDPKKKKLDKLLNELYNRFTGNFLFEPESQYGNKKEKIIIKEKENLENEISKLSKELDEIKASTIYKNAFEWRFEFPEVLNNDGDFEGFDLVIGNPPYGVSIKGGQRDAIVASLNKVPDFEIYYFFINIAKKILKPNGIKTYIIPNSILFNVFAKSYRENLFNQWQIRELLDCTDFNIFEGSATVRCIITLLINKQSDDKVFYRPTANATSFEELISRRLSETTKDILLANNQNWALIFKLNADVLNIVAKIRKNKKILIDLFPEISQGLIAYDKYQGQDEETIKNRIFHSNQKQNGWKKWLWGEDITPYRVKWNEKEFINYCDGIANPREPKYFKGVRILIREITNPKIFAGFTTDESYNDPAIIIVLKNKEGNFDIKLLLGILNSTLATFYHFNSSPKATKGAFPKILVDDIKNFPLPNHTEQQPIITIVDQILEAKKQGKDTAELEKQIDTMVYKLYDLSEEEIKIVEGK
ncbi:MAG: Eco57I restriction-modification methylase domain-containing protein [Bacteroidia bacterium]|nr:Eco57I restriction-modification methylase domain-containing protein [Bacteroidia bacterium]